MKKAISLLLAAFILLACVSCYAESAGGSVSNGILEILSELTGDGETETESDDQAAEAPAATQAPAATSIPSTSEFTLHSGVAFGMTIKEVESCERSAGFTLMDYDRYGDYATDRAKTIKEINGKIAGIDYSYIDYMFDSDGKLYSATYWLGPEILNEQIKEDFETIDSALKSKYGEPDDLWLPVVKRLGFEADHFPELWGIEIPEDHYPVYSSWLIEQGDGTCVVIVHYRQTVLISGETLSFNFHILGYQLFSVEEIKAAINEMESEMNNLTEQRNNDI